jgi:hypothetical protein
VHQAGHLLEKAMIFRPHMFKCSGYVFLSCICSLYEVRGGGQCASLRIVLRSTQVGSIET